MGATTFGALVGGAIDAMSGDDSSADGAIVGAIAANVLKVAIPVAVTFAVGWVVLRGLERTAEGIGSALGGDEPQP